MLKTLGIVQACFRSDRFRCMVGRKLGGRSMLEWVVRRVTDCTRLDGVIVLACDREEHQFVRELVPADVPVFVGPQSDALSRFTKALEEYSAEAVVRVRGDNPFIYVHRRDLVRDRPVISRIHGVKFVTLLHPARASADRRLPILTVLGDGQRLAINAQHQRLALRRLEQIH